MAATDISNPILNSPYASPEAYFELGPNGPTGVVLTGRRPSESFIPIPAGQKRGGEQQAFDFDATGERREQNSLINDIRREVERWRAGNWNGVTPYSRKLLAHWAAGPPTRDEPVFFCQREAAETAIFLAEVAGRHGSADYRRRLEPENALHNDGLPRVGLKMATGTGKTVVMGMLIAWQTINKVMAPKDARFAKRFLIVTPGITIRDRLGVLHPEREDNYYRERDLVPSDLWDALLQAQIQIVNYHAFLPRDAKEIQGVAANTRKLLRGGRPESADAFQETPDMVAARVLRGFGSDRGEIVVLNDEAHHCYQDKLLEHPDEEADKEDRERNRDARVWFRGLCDLRRKSGIKAVYDLSATPYYLKGSGYNEGFIFPWVVSDFSLMDAIESGIVKVPRVPVDDDAAGSELVYLHLWDHIQPPLPKRKSATALDPGGRWVPPVTLEGALLSLYRSYSDNHARYEADARGARRAAAGDDRRLSQHDRLEARVRLDRRPGGRAARRQQTPGARPALAVLERRGRRLEHPAADDHRRLRPARVRRAARSRVQEGRRARDRGVQAGLPAAQPGRRRRQAERCRPAARSDEHDRQARQARRAHPLRRVGGDAHRRLGREHRHPHPRHPAVPQPATLRAGRRPRAAPPQLRGRPFDRPLRAGVRRGVRRAVRVHSFRPAHGRAEGAAARGRGTGR